jgi:Domain of unknown function (DUF397)
MNKIGLSRAEWHKSSHSSQDGSCVEIARNLPGIVAIRDSKDPEGPKLAVAPDKWLAFTAGVKAGQFDLS